MKTRFHAGVLSICVALSAAIPLNSLAQNTLTESDRQLIIQQLKKEVKAELLDSLRVAGAPVQQAPAPTPSTPTQITNTATMDTSGGIRIGKLAIGGYLDTYYGYNFNRPASGDVPYFVSMARHNEANINLAAIDVRYTTERLRSVLVVGFGSYVNANYAAEPGSLKNLIEARVGVKPFKRKEIWIDFGVLGSPYTNESAISKDHMMYTRSFAPEYVPYYLAGAKISVPLGKKVNGYLYLLNGWQQIMDANSGKSVGTQIEWRVGKKSLLNWNTYVGDERSAAAPNNRMRYFTDVFWIFNPDGKFSLTSCAYIGIQQRVDSLGTSSHKYWWQANVIGRYSFTPKISLSGRFEYFSDPNSVQITSINPMGGFSSYSAGLCFNLKLFDNAMFRLEGRHFFAEKNVYQSESGTPRSQMTWLVGNVTLWF
jgi:hypothetical protein